jgi:hypothetical protein
VRRSDAQTLALEVANNFDVVDSFYEIHLTPWHSEQQFLYATLRRR